MTRKDFLKGLLGAGAVVAPVAAGSPILELATRISKPQESEPVEIYKPSDVPRYTEDFRKAIVFLPLGNETVRVELAVDQWEFATSCPMIDVTSHNQDPNWRKLISGPMERTFRLSGHVLDVKRSL